MEKAPLENDEQSEENGVASVNAQEAAEKAVQGAAANAQGAKAGAQGATNGPGPVEMKSGWTAKKVVSKLDIQHFLTAGPGLDEYIMSQQEMEPFSLVQRVQACHDAL